MRVASIDQTTCPRCGAVVAGKFKFCPECACRLRPGPRGPDTPPKSQPRWPTILLALAAALVTGTVIVLGLLLFILDRPDAEPQRQEVDVPPVAERQVLTVRDIPHQMVTIPAGVAWYEEEDDGSLTPVYTWPFRMMRYEVTRGQYAEFLSYVTEDASVLTRQPFVRDLWRPAEPDKEGKEAWARGNLELWWEAVRDHLSRRLPPGETIERPASLTFERDEDFLLDDELGVLLLTPPHWIQQARDGALTWAVPAGTENWPVTEVSFYDALAFESWAIQYLQISHLKIPNMGEWRRAYHGNRPHHGDPTEVIWPWGTREDPFGCNNLNFFMDENDAQPWPVQKLYSSHGGLTLEGAYSMAGNAAEWVREWHLGKSRRDASRLVVEDGLSEEEAWRETGRRETRGGSFYDGIQDCTLDSSKTLDMRARDYAVGFRLVERLLR